MITDLKQLQQIAEDYISLDNLIREFKDKYISFREEIGDKGDKWYFERWQVLEKCQLYLQFSVIDKHGHEHSEISYLPIKYLLLADDEWKNAEKIRLNDKEEEKVKADKEKYNRIVTKAAVDTIHD